MSGKQWEAQTKRFEQLSRHKRKWPSSLCRDFRLFYAIMQISSFGSPLSYAFSSLVQLRFDTDIILVASRFSRKSLISNHHFLGLLCPAACGGRLHTTICIISAYHRWVLLIAMAEYLSRWKLSSTVHSISPYQRSVLVGKSIVN